MRYYKSVIWFVIGLWLVTNVATLDYNGPFYDEAIYITAGERTLEGHGYSDGYLVWFAGSLLWPMMAALGYRAAGLVGTRLLAVVLCVLAYVAVVWAARNLFGERASVWTAVALGVSGPFIALSRLGVIDVLSLAGVAGSLWAVTELVKRDHRLWMLIAALSFTVGFFGKYPMGLMVFPLIGVLWVLRRDKAIFDIGLFGFMSLGLTLAFYVPGRPLLKQVIPWTLATKPEFGYTPAMLWFELAYVSVVPLLLSIIGWLFCRDKRRLASILVASLLIWPAYHVLSFNPVGQQKHVVVGFLFAYPLIGLALHRLWESSVLHRVSAAIILVGMVALGLVQAQQFGRWWPDWRGAATYLAEVMRPGEKLLVNEEWPFILYLYSNEKITKPTDVSNVLDAVDTNRTASLCDYDWFVDARGSYDWPESVLQRLEECGTFRPAYTGTLPVVGLNQRLELVNFPVTVTIMAGKGKEVSGSYEAMDR